MQSTSESLPRIKGAQLQNSLHTARDMAQAEARLAVLEAKLGPDYLAEVASFTRTEWISVEFDIRLSHAVESCLGRGADYERARRSTGRSFESKLLQPFVEGAVRLFGLSPKAMIKLVRRGWTSLYQNCGEADAAFGDDDAPTAALTLSRLPDVVYNDAVYLQAIAGGLHAILDVCQVKGTVEVQGKSPARKSATFAFKWTVSE